MSALRNLAAVILVAVGGYFLFQFSGFGMPHVAEPPDIEVPDPTEVYDPVSAGEPTPPGFRQVLRRDGIAPIYFPVHVEADEIDWDDDTLVIGIAIGDEARAYPVRSLNRREIVNDRIADTPILASW